MVVRGLEFGSIRGFQAGVGFCGCLKGGKGMELSHSCVAGGFHVEFTAWCDLLLSSSVRLQAGDEVRIWWSIDFPWNLFSSPLI